MTNAIERGATGEALRELALKLDAGEYPVMILGQLAWYVRTKLAPARVRPAVEAAVPDGPRPEDLAAATRGCSSSGWSSSCAGREGRRTAPSRSYVARRGRSTPRLQPRLVARRRVLVDDALGDHPVDQGDGLLQLGLGLRELVLVDERADGPQRAAQLRAQLAVPLAADDVLAVRLQRGCMTSHSIL